MSNTLTKSLILTHPKSGQIVESTVAVLTHTTSLNEDGSVVIAVEIPGVDPSTVEVSCESNILKIVCPKGEATLSVAPGTEISEIKAEILWGLLTLVIPPAAAPSVQTIKVNLLDTVKKAPVKSQVSKHQSEVTSEVSG
jgi:HSP20 family molecular chaperone IbpA